MYVLGTAGHVDHGKSTLVKALTGIDPDRLAEEKERGLTIDLGFAWLKLPGGQEVSIVDVPGHERFIKNMLAGVGGIDLALLVIAADEGVMPQTREHLAILDLLHISRAIVVITKKDLADEEMLEIVKLDIEEVLKGTSLEGAPLVTTSAVTGEGLPELLSTIERLLQSTPPRRDIGKPRLPIDRVFTMKGFGTVVTGTLIDGRLSLGQPMEILPGGQRTTIRGLQTHRKKAETVLPGTRVAVNIAGVAVEEIQRGMVMTTPGWLLPTRFLDVRLRAVADLAQPITHNKTISFHTGTAEVTGKLRLLDREKLGAGESGWAQVLLLHPVAVARGDLCIVRSAAGTLGGGMIVDTHPRRHRRFQPSVIEALEAREKGSPEDVVLTALQTRNLTEMGAFLAQCNLSEKQATQALQTLLAEGRIVILGEPGPKAILLSRTEWDRLVGESRKAAEAYHAQFPLRMGIPKEELRSRLKISPAHFNAVLERLIGDGVLIEEKALIRTPTHAIRLNPRQQAQADAFLKSLAQNPFSPLAESLPEPELLNMLIETRRVVRVNENVIFTAEAYDEMVKRVVEHLRTNGKITVAEVRDMFQTSRKYALALMEHLDELKITRRIGDERVLR